VTQLALSPHVVIVHPSLPVKSIGDLVRLAKAKPGAINYAGTTPGTAVFLAAELFKRLAGISIVYVPYRGGGEALTSLISGETSVFFAPVAITLPLIRERRFRLLAVTTAKRLPAMPEYPTVAEAGYPEYAFENWYGLMVAAKTPKETITAIRTAVVSASNIPSVSKRFSDLGYIFVGNQPDEFAVYLKSEIEKLGKTVREAGVTLQ